MLLCDAHAHLGNDTEWEERTGKGILSLICATGPGEAGKLFSRLEWLKGRAVIPTAGLHPWYADQYTVQDMEPYIRRCPVVGEIGMDSVWCQVPLPIQERVFREQLAMACSLKKPVVLHTKGQEKAIASILKEYPNRYLVHWYSCEEYLEEYLALDCYFSVGPDAWWNPAVAQAARRVPRDRILVETDGLGAVQWAYENGPEDGKRTAPGTVSEALENTVRTMAEIVEETEKHIHYAKRFRNNDFKIKNRVDAISHATCGMAIDINAKAIVVASISGMTVRMVSRFRAPTDIIGMATNRAVWYKLALSWGVMPVLSEKFDSTDVLFYHAQKVAKDALNLKPGDNIIMTGGAINGKSGNTNLIKIETIE